MGHNRKHHYIPQFYLRGFSSGSRKIIDVYHMPTNKRITDVAIKNQAQRQNFYGNIKYEKFLASIESKIAPPLIHLRENAVVPKYSSDDYISLQMLLLSTLSRTEKARNERDSAMTKSVKLILEEIPEHQDLLEHQNLMTENSSHFALESLFEFLLYISDLKLGIVRCSEHAFFGTDSPVNLVNPFLESRIKNRSVTGLVERGLVMIMPVSSQITLIAYDPWVYKFRSKNNVLDIGSQEVEYYNLLQGVCMERVAYCSAFTRTSLIRNAITKAKRFRPGSRSRVRFEKLYMDNDPEPKDMIAMSRWEPRLGIIPPGLKFLRFAKNIPLSDTAVQIRNPILYDMIRRREHPTGKADVQEMIADIREHLGQEKDKKKVRESF